jgi:type VI secretion system protein ImpH
MAGENRTPRSDLDLLDALARAPQELDFFQVLRRLECLHPDKPRLGEGVHPAEEPVRLGQEPALAFSTSTLASFHPGSGTTPPRLGVHFFGMFGAHGPLPLHLTEYARDRVRNANDPTLVRFLDMFHHRMLSLFYRAWANSQPTVSLDRPRADRFASYVGALFGLALPTVRQRDAIPDATKLYYAGRFAAQARNAEGLKALVGDFFQVPAAIEEFVGTWIEIPVDSRWRLGKFAKFGLGQSTILGSHSWQRQFKFRIVLGPLDPEQYHRFLPGGHALKQLIALVRGYAGDELDWDVRLIPDHKAEQPWRLGTYSRLGWTTWLGRSLKRRPREDLVLSPVFDGRPQ